MCLCHHYLSIGLRSSQQLSSSACEGGNVRKWRTFKFGLTTRKRQAAENRCWRKGKRCGLVQTDGEEPVFSGGKDDNTGWTQVLPVKTKEILSFFGYFITMFVLTVQCAYTLPRPSPLPPLPAHNASSSARQDALAPFADASPAPRRAPDTHRHVRTITNHKKATMTSASQSKARHEWMNKTRYVH